MEAQTLEKPKRICPWWLGYFMDNPVRRMLHPAEKILGPYVSEGMTVLDFGCGFGHFSLGMAALTGASGRVFAADIQQKMLNKTMARARKSGLAPIIHPLLCNGLRPGDPLELDFALACNSLHETPDPAATLADFFDQIKPGGRFLLMEPRGHMKPGQFETEIDLAKAAGFVEAERPKVIGELCVLFVKPEKPSKSLQEMPVR